MTKLFPRTGIIGGTPPFDPTFGVPDCIVAVYSDLGVTKDESNRVSGWADQVNGYDFTQATDAKKPVWTDAIQNGYPGLYFDAVDDVLQNASVTFDDATIFLVVWPQSGYGRALCGRSATSLTLMLLFNDNADYAAYYDNLNAEIVVETPMPNVTRVVAVDFIKNGDGHYYKNGDLLNSFTRANNGVIKLALGGTYDTGAEGLGGYLFAVLVYNSALSTADRQTIEAGLNALYNVWTP